jgi:hypothetical protein
VRANIVKTLEKLDRYPLCDHRSIIGKAKHPYSLVTRCVLRAA